MNSLPDYEILKIIDLAVRHFKEEQTNKSVFSKSSGYGYRDHL